MMDKLHFAFTRTTLVLGNLAAPMVGDVQKDPVGTSRQLTTGKKQHLFLDDVADRRLKPS